ncbi:DUF934 domain-containing protein [Ferrovum sp.]|uniref:DUF934 domain-containing protein n=1 Tax=Ferrovum sp. TaxID=2609467 RepID=UPI00262F555F|nr:DUF934 domain-containing protein [Ferrovum sp.]
MREVVVNRQIVPDTWARFSPEQPEAGGDRLYRLEEWQAVRAQASAGRAGLWVETDQDPEVLRPYLPELALIAIHIGSFADGRGHSLGRLLREVYGYQGEIRAVGDVFQDTVNELERCGFNGFSPRPGETAANLLRGLGLFSEAYQISVERPEPLFRRRLSHPSGG